MKLKVIKRRRAQPRVKREPEAPVPSPVACGHEGCQAEFARTCDMLRHRRMVHDQATLTGCPHCGRSFSTARYAQVHARACQFRPAETPRDAGTDEDEEDSDAPERLRHRCEACGGSYAHSESFRAHLHYCKGAAGADAAEQLSCQLCAASFGRLHDLKRHVELTHQGIKRLACHLCFKPFGRTSHLRRHLDNVHSEGRIRLARRKRRPQQQRTDGDDDESSTAEQSLLCPFQGCGSELDCVDHLRQHLAAHCGPSRGDGDHDDGEAKAEDVAASPTRRRGRRKRAPDPYMCPMDRICRCSFVKFTHLTRHLRTTHKHLFEAGWRADLVRRCTTLRLAEEGEGQGDDSRGGGIGRSQLRRSVMVPPKDEVAYDSLLEVDG